MASKWLLQFIMHNQSSNVQIPTKEMMGILIVIQNTFFAPVPKTMVFGTFTKLNGDQEFNKTKAAQKKAASIIVLTGSNTK